MQRNEMNLCSSWVTQKSKYNILSISNFHYLLAFHSLLKQRQQWNSAFQWQHGLFDDDDNKGSEDNVWWCKNKNNASVTIRITFDDKKNKNNNYIKL